MTPLVARLFVTTLLFALGLFGQTPVGSLKLGKGEVSVLRAGAPVKPVDGLHLLVGDVVKTGENSSAGIAFLDGTRCALGANSELTVRRFLFEPSNNSFGLGLDLVKGIFTYISGKIAKFAPDAVEIKTPVGIAGTRGTALAVRIGSDAQ